MRLDGRWEQKRGAYKRTDRRDTYRLHWISLGGRSTNRVAASWARCQGVRNRGAAGMECAKERKTDIAQNQYPARIGG